MKKTDRQHTYIQDNRETDMMTDKYTYIRKQTDVKKNRHGGARLRQTNRQQKAYMKKQTENIRTYKITETDIMTDKYTYIYENRQT